MAVAIALSGTWRQWARPFLEFDDWDMLLANGQPFVMDHTERLLYEGRWLNYWWWNVSSNFLSPTAAMLLFSCGWLVAVAFFVRALNIGRWSIPAVVGLYCTPMMADLSAWPATLAAPVCALAGTLAALWVTRLHPGRHIAALVIGVTVVTMGYPPLALVILAYVVVLHHADPWRQIAKTSALFLASYVGALLTVFALNYATFGVFGIQIQEWRHPTPLTDLGSLRAHLHVVKTDWNDLFHVVALPLLASAIALLIALREQHLRKRLAVLALAFGLAASLAAAATITNGVYSPFRSMGWIWAFVLPVVAWILEGKRVSVRALGASLLTLVSLWSAAYWNYTTISYDHRQIAMDQFRTEIAAIVKTKPQAPIVFLFDPNQPQNMWRLGRSLAYRDHLSHSEGCSNCKEIEDYAAKFHILDQVFWYEGRWIVRFSPQFAIAATGTPPYPSWLVPFLT